MEPVMDFLLSFIPGGGLTAIIAGAVAALGILWRLLAGAKKAGRNEQLVKEAKARDENLKRIQDAIRARDAVRPDDGGVQSDPRNRDNKRV
jgi:hypothetical protein